MLRVILGLLLCGALVGCFEDDPVIPDASEVTIEPVEADEIDSAAIGRALDMLENIDEVPGRVERLAYRMLDYVSGFDYYDCYYYDECYYAPSEYRPQALLDSEDLDCETGAGTIDYNVAFDSDTAFGIYTEESIVEMIVDASNCELVVDYDYEYDEVHIPYDNAITGFTHIERGFGASDTLDSGDLLVIHGANFGSYSSAYYGNDYVRLVTDYYPRYSGYKFYADDAEFWTSVSVAVELPAALTDSTFVVEAMMYDTDQGYATVVDGLGITSSGGTSLDWSLEDDYDWELYELENYYEYVDVVVPVTAKLHGRIEIGIAKTQAEVETDASTEYKLARYVVGRGSISLDDTRNPIEIVDLDLEYESDFDGHWSLQVTGSLNDVGGKEDLLTTYDNFAAATTTRAEAREAGYTGPEGTEVTGTVTWSDVDGGYCETNEVVISTISPLIAGGEHCPAFGAIKLNDKEVIFEYGTTLLYGSGVTYGRVPCEDVLTESLEDDQICRDTVLEF